MIYVSCTISLGSKYINNFQFLIITEKLTKIKQLFIICNFTRIEEYRSNSSYFRGKLIIPVCPLRHCFYKIIRPHAVRK